MSTNTKKTATTAATPWADRLANLIKLGAIPAALHRIYLWSEQPGTGKSSFARRIFGDKVEVVACTASTTAEQLLRGEKELVASESGGTSSVTRPDCALRAFRDGKPLQLDEINLLTMSEVQGAIHALLDDKETARITLDRGLVVRPHANYLVIATGNVPPSALPEPVRDRFDLIVHCGNPAPGIAAALRASKLPGLADILQNHFAQAERETPATIAPRNLLRLARLCDYLPPEDAGRALFGQAGVDLVASAIVR